MNLAARSCALPEKELGFVLADRSVVRLKSLLSLIDENKYLHLHLFHPRTVGHIREYSIDGTELALVKAMSLFGDPCKFCFNYLISHLLRAIRMRSPLDRGRTEV